MVNQEIRRKNLDPGLSHINIIRPIKDPIDFLGLCMKLQQPKKNGKILNIKIMDTLFFFQREPCLLIYNEGERGVKMVKEK